MKYLCLFSAFLIVFYLASCRNPTTNRGHNSSNVQSDIQTTSNELIIDLQKILKHKSRSDLIDIAIKYDQHFKKSKNYLGYELRPLIDSIIKVNRFDTTNTMAIFECIDGYRPALGISSIFTDTKGYIAIKDMESINGKNWIDSLESKFSPYYVVWQNIDSSNHTFPWPYGLTKIRLVPYELQYKTIYPVKNPEMVKGFILFRDNCNKCHSLNHIGGGMGPEFNIPKNITEYWKEEDILKFAMNPKLYRSSSQMPPMKDIISLEDLKIIINYLRFISNHKVAN